MSDDKKTTVYDSKASKSTRATAYGTITIQFSRRERFVFRSTIVLTVLGIILTIANAVFNQKRLPATTDEQIAKLQETETALKNLTTFVQDQQTKLKESESIVNSLKSEHEKLKPVVEADRKIVDAVLNAQADAQRSSVWWERGYGFIFGVFSSLVASSIWSGVALLKAKRIAYRQQTPAPTDAQTDTPEPAAQ